ncbi:MAG TPA: hypothetical protein VG013_15480 [Gemmataceae bacterium]|jgi:hypothetical protein|nr:hypothetical protein [Gemmataceae bacterium]
MPEVRGPREEFLPAGATTIAGDAEDVLVSDARGDLTPAQMVEQKLMALLWGRPSAVRATGGVEDVRRVNN